MNDTDILANLAPCGYILAANSYKYFALQCLYCDEKYGHWTSFLRHIKTEHSSFESDSHELLFNMDSEEADKECPEMVVELVDTPWKYKPKVMTLDKSLQLKVESPIHGNKLSNVFLKIDNVTDKIQEVIQQREENVQGRDGIPFILESSDKLQNSAHDSKGGVDNNELKLKSILKLHNNFLNISNRLQCEEEVHEGELKCFEQCNFLIILTSSRVNEEMSKKDDDNLGHNINDSETSATDFEFSDRDGEDSSENEGTQKFTINLRNQNKATSDFIDWYSQYPCLWNPEYSDYNDPTQRTLALANINKYFLVNYNDTFTAMRLNNAIKRLNSFYKRCCYTKRQMSSTRRYYFDRCSFLAGIELDDRIHVKNISSKKLLFGKTDKLTLGFIDLCKNYPVLYDRNHKNYSVYKERKNANEQFAENLKRSYAVNFNKEEVYDGISRLKLYFYNLQDKERKNAPLTKSDLVYLERCKFLPPSKKKVECKICGRIMRSDITMQVHLLKEHNIGELPYKCSYCDMRFPHRTTKMEHEVRAHTKKFEWFCQYCNKGFASRRDKILHELVHTGERNCICEQCGKGFRLKHQLLEHVQVVHDRVRQYKCTMCPKDYLRKRHLDDHIRGHLNIRDKICPTCGKAFTNFHSLFRHKQLHSEIKRYECKVCGERFHQFVGLNGHMKRKHNIVKNLNPILVRSLTKESNVNPDTEVN